MTLWTILAITLSTILIAVLCHRDPKRRRTARLLDRDLSRVARRLLAAVACVPGLVFAVAGDAPAFLIWLGGCAVAGWFVTQCFAKARRAG